MKLFLIIILYSIFISCGSSKKSSIKDDRFTVYPPLSAFNDSLHILIYSSQLLPGIAFNRGGFEFQAAFRNEDTAYLGTRDPRFSIPEGYRTGNKYKELPDLVKQNLLKEPGWGYHYTFPSGWSIGFCNGNSCTDSLPGEETEINWIFWRN